MRKADRDTLAALLIVAALAIAAMAYFGNGESQTPAAEADSARAAGGKETGKSAKEPIYYNVEKREPELFPFDPNTADSAQLLRLGLRPWQVRSIYKYRAAGGIYRRPIDFARVYGITQGQYRRLEPYIRIASDYQPASKLYHVEAERRRDSMAKAEKQREYEARVSRYHTKIKEGERIVLNTADTTELVKVPGIGDYYARMIVEYGERLGGYVSVDQLEEVENFPTEAKKYFIISNPNPRKINVNKLSLGQLRRHPYVNYYFAKAILDYRRLYGKIDSLGCLKTHPDCPEEKIRRLEPYVEY